MLPIHVYFRHYVGDIKTFNIYKEIVSVLTSLKLPRDFSLAFYLNYNANLSEKFKDKIFETSEPLIEKDIAFSAKIAYGAGNAFLDALEESVSIASVERKKFVTFLIDADQYPLQNKKFYRDLQELAKLVIKNKAILGIAMRTNISLGKGKLNVLRQIEEIFHALYIQPSLKIFKKADSIPSHYKDLGDPVPGCYCINTMHKNFFTLLKACFYDSLHSNLNKYAGDPYIVMKSSELGKIVQNKVLTKSNPPGEFNIKAMKEKNRYLMKTSLGSKYRKLVKSNKAEKVLLKYFNKKDLERVKKIILCP